jgi:glycosyltransferase involved in cell wall biosynthesis
VADVPVKVLHVVNGDEYGGSERVQDLLAAHLPEHGFEVGFACVKPGAYAELREGGEWPLVRLPMGSRADVRVVAALARLVRGGGYAMVHTHTPRAAMVARPAAAAARVPMVHHVHGSTLAVWPSRVRNGATALVERLSVARVAAVLAVSSQMVAELRRLGVPRRRVVLTPNGVPGTAVLPSRPPPAGEWRLGTAARLRPAKGLETLLEALARLRREGLAARLRVLGEFESEAYAAELRGLAARLGVSGQVAWAGFRSDMAAELSRMDAFVLPSLHEGIPMAVLEAMAAGVPVVASRVGGVPEVLRADLDGLLVPPGDAAALAGALGRLMRGEASWHALRASAHDRQLRRYSAQAMTARVAGVYREVLAAGRPA